VRAMRVRIDIKIKAKVAIQMKQHVQVELGRDTSAVIVGTSDSQRFESR
jgi:hypothetical protein